MLFNVAQLLKSPVGTSLESDFNEEQVQLDDELKLSGPITGHARMRHINQGLLVDGWVDLTLEMACVRCLKEFQQPLHVTFEERFVPTVDVVTGAPVRFVDEGDDVFFIDDHHQVDLTEAIRQRTLLELPTAPLCKPDCAGLCPSCGHDLNTGPCDCEPEVDTRLSALKVLLQNDSTN
jgi:DUF177 domain-containing protein